MELWRGAQDARRQSQRCPAGSSAVPPDAMSAAAECFAEETPVWTLSFTYTTLFGLQLLIAIRIFSDETLQFTHNPLNQIAIIDRDPSICISAHALVWIGASGSVLSADGRRCPQSES